MSFVSICYVNEQKTTNAQTALSKNDN